MSVCLNHCKGKRPTRIRNTSLNGLNNLTNKINTCRCWLHCTPTTSIAGVFLYQTTIHCQKPWLIYNSAWVHRFVVLSMCISQVAKIWCIDVSRGPKNRQDKLVCPPALKSPFYFTWGAVSLEENEIPVWNLYPYTLELAELKQDYFNGGGDSENWANISGSACEPRHIF